jgi:hypothetical protein
MASRVPAGSAEPTGRFGQFLDVDRNSTAADQIDQFVARSRCGLGVDVRQVDGDGAAREVELLGDLCMAETLGPPVVNETAFVVRAFV